jgi:hypothetical protein
MHKTHWTVCSHWWITISIFICSMPKTMLAISTMQKPPSIGRMSSWYDEAAATAIPTDQHEIDLIRVGPRCARVCVVMVYFLYGRTTARSAIDSTVGSSCVDEMAITLSYSTSCEQLSLFASLKSPVVQLMKNRYAGSEPIFDGRAERNS